MTTPFAFNSSTAMRAPFSLSLPRWAIAPEVAATWPILITSCAYAALAERHANTTAWQSGLTLNCIWSFFVATRERLSAYHAGAGTTSAGDPGPGAVDRLRPARHQFEARGLGQRRLETALGLPLRGDFFLRFPEADRQSRQVGRAQ